MNEKSGNNPTISVVMPVYNVAAYVERCLRSVMRQSFPATECIIVDDASPDDSIARCERLIEDYKGPTHFRILHHDHNRGISATRNTGTDAATSDYIYYIDSDDEITPDCLEKLVSPLMHDDTIEMVMGAYRVDSFTKSVLGRRLSFHRTRFLKNMPSELRSNEDVYKWYYRGIEPTICWNKLLRLSFVRDNRLCFKEGIVYEDCLWTFCLMRCLHHAVFIHDVTYLYHRNRFSIRAIVPSDVVYENFGCVFKEMTDRIVPGQRTKETVRWAYLFGNLYIDAFNHAEFKRIYPLYKQELSNGGQHYSSCRLRLIHLLSKRKTGRILFKAVMRVSYLAQLFKDVITNARIG